ncbi:hypothetical protein LOK49_LG04G03070 [Camellia lanceoleosa]|uniref:Uncharacterized protein n=1 Tax=Camellia lanceoleosa TaxID=1840588 RepID=A0ACC0I2W8_9ERIC|nr:hypothetical protein LOK49_LG04G03070 [Camellia lanceoleosa]
MTGDILEDPAKEPNKDMYMMTIELEDAPNQPEYVQIEMKTILKVSPGSSNASGPSSSKEQHNQQYLVPEATIKVGKKQIHLGTIRSQEVAARLYDRRISHRTHHQNHGHVENDESWVPIFVMWLDTVTYLHALVL